MIASGVRGLTLRRVLLVLGAVLLLAGLSAVAWALIIPTPMPEALAALDATAQVQVRQGPWLVFEPTSGSPQVGLIFYPGGRVDYRAYAPAAQAIAAQGFVVVVVPVPLNLAVLSPDKAGEVIAAFPEIQRWAVGGHSLGGAMAARFSYYHPEQVEGLVLWAAYPPGGNNLADRGLAVTVVYGTRDGVAPPEQVLASESLLPNHTQWVAIEGGNHAQFGWYGSQSGDNPAAISREAQQNQAVSATVDLLRTLT